MAIKYRWVAERLELMIERQIQKGIHKLPTEQELCGRYRVSRQTVRTALKLLEQKTMARRHRKKTLMPKIRRKRVNHPNRSLPME